MNLKKWSYDDFPIAPSPFSLLGLASAWVDIHGSVRRYEGIYMFLTLKDKIDNLCDYTYNFTWQNNKIRPDSVIPSQLGTNYTFSDLVN